MNASSTAGQRARAFAVLALAGFALHQLRYLVAFGGDAGAALSAQGHGYLEHALPVLLGLGLLALGVTVLRSLLWPDRIGAAGPGLARATLACVGVLLAAYSVQELVEGALAGGHPGGLSALFGGGGWLALPLAVALGLAAALALRALAGLEPGIAARVRRRPLRPRRARRAPSPPSTFQIPRASAPLAFGLARRPPPAPSIR